MPDQADVDAGAFADRLASTGDEELFETMQGLEEESEGIRPDERNGSDVFAKSRWSRRPSRIDFRASSLRRTRIGNSVGPLAEQERLS